MAAYTPKKPYGSRWNFRTPSPPPSSVIEPISPVGMKNDSVIIFPDPSTVLNTDAIEYQSRHPSHEEPRSDSTLSLLSSVSPPSASSSRRQSPNTMGRSIGSSEVPTFAGNQYWDPLAFFADVALSSADPTTLPKLQKLAAKDAAQRMEASPADVSPPRSAPEAPQNGQTPTATAGHISRRLSIVSTGVENSSPPRYFLPPVSGILPQFGPGQLAHTTFYRSTNIAAGSPVESERIDLAPIRDMTPPSSNASITGNIETRPSRNQLPNGPSVIPHPKAAILPSPPLAVYPGVQHASDNGELFSDSPAKRSKTTSQHSGLLSKNAEAVESSTNTERLSAGTAREEDTITVEQATRTQKGKRRGRGGKAVATRVDTITPVKRDVPKAKKGRLTTPTSSIAVRRSTRNIRYIEEPEDHIITRPPAKVETQHEHGTKQHNNPQRIVLHVARNHVSSTTRTGVSPTAGNGVETTAHPQNTTEQALPHAAQLTSLNSQDLEGSYTPGLESTTAEHGAPSRGDTALALKQTDISKEQKNRDSDMMSIVDRVQKQLMLNSDSGSIPGHSKSCIDQIASHTPDQSKSLITPGNILNNNTPREPMYSANLHLDRHGGVSGFAESASSATCNRKTSIDAQAIVDALQQAPLPPLFLPPVPAPQQSQPSREQSPQWQSLPLMSARQIWGELKSGKEPAAPPDTPIEEAWAHSVQPQSLEYTKLESMKLIDKEDGVTSTPDEAEQMEMGKEEVVGENVPMEVSQQPAVEIIDARELAIDKPSEELVEEEPGLSETVTLATRGSATRVVSRSPPPTAELAMDMALREASNEADTSVEEIPPANSPEEEPTPEGMGKPVEISVGSQDATTVPVEISVDSQDATTVPVEGGADISAIPEGVIFSDAVSPSVITNRGTADIEAITKDVEIIDAPRLSEDCIDILEPRDIEEVNSDAKIDEGEAPVVEATEAQCIEQEHLAQESLEVQQTGVEHLKAESVEEELIGAKIIEAEASAGEASAGEACAGEASVGEASAGETFVGEVFSTEVVVVEVREDEAASTESTEPESTGVEATPSEPERSTHTSAEHNEQMTPEMAPEMAPEFAMPNATSSSLFIPGILEHVGTNVVPPTRDPSPNFSIPLVESVQTTPNVDSSDLTGPTGAPETPPNNDLCLVCNSSTFIGTEANPTGGQASGEATLKWIECDNCKRWTHNACVNLSNEEVDSIDKYHCASCEKDKGPSTLLRKSARARIPIDYESLNNGSAVPVQSATNKMYHPYVDKILNGEFKTVLETFPRVVPEELSLRFFEDGGGFKEPVVIPAVVNPYPRKLKASSLEGNAGTSISATSSRTSNVTSVGASARQPTTPGENLAYQKESGIELDALGMGFPDSLTIPQIVEMVGPEETVEVIDVKSQSGDKRKWTLSKWVEYFEDPNRDKIYNVISLEVSSTRLARLIQRPKVVREMDLSDQVWPKDKRKEFPAVQYYCLMSVAHSYTDWHVDFGGSSVYYRILKGRKVFFFLAPTKENLDAYQQWNKSPEQHYTWLAEGRECFRIDLGPGDTMLIPSGWIHAVYTPEDSLVIGGNYLTRLHYQMQFRIHEIERATATPIKYRFPRFARVHWYDAIKLIQEDPIPKNIDDQLIAGKAANFRSIKAKGSAGSLSIHFLEGLPAVAEFLRRNSLIAQEIITEGLTKQKTEAVRNAIPKGFDDGWDTVQNFARWVTWKRNCGEVIPPWAHPDADPAEGVPNAGQRKLSAAAIKHAERLKADADRRAAGVVRSGLRERNQSIQPSLSGASETPAPEEARVSKKRPRLDFGELKDAEPPRKKSRSQKERLDQSVIDECVEQVVAEYEKSGDPIKEALAVEVRTQYRNVHITRLGPSRSACHPCREGKTKCVHKDEIRALISKVLDLYHTVKGTPSNDRREANAEFLGEQSPQLEDQPAAEQLAPGRTSEKVSKPDSDVLQAGPSQTPGPSTQVVLNLTKGITPKGTKRPQSKIPRSKNVGNDSGEPRRRGGKRTACDACRKSRRKCAHGIDGASLTAGPQAEDDADSDDDQSAREPTVMLEGTDETTGPVHGAREASINANYQADEGSPLSEQATPSEQLLQENELLAQQLQQDLMQDLTQSMSPEHVSLEETVTLSQPMGRETSSEHSRESKEMEAPRNTMDIIANSAGRGKRKRVAEIEEEYVSARILETASGGSQQKKPQVTPSPSSSRRTRPAPSFDESRGSPRRLRMEDMEASPKENRVQNTPEKQAWQEMKAAEFGLRKRSKSKSSS